MTTPNDNLLTTLSSLGLSENEARVFLACLEIGSSTVWQISKASGIKRPTCYVILEELTFRGLASSTRDARSIKYAVISPRQLAVILERKHTKALESIAQLQAIASQAKEKPKITTFEGKEGIRQVYNLILEMPQGSTTYVIGDNLLAGSYSDILTEFVAHRVKKNIATKAIFPDTPENRKLMTSDQKRELRLIPSDQYNPKTQVDIFGDTVAYISHGETEPFATVIQSHALADDERQKFELIWNSIAQCD